MRELQALGDNKLVLNKLDNEKEWSMHATFISFHSPRPYLGNTDSKILRKNSHSIRATCHDGSWE